MGILKEEYGTLGKKSRREWEDLLSSDQGLFKRQRRAPRSIVGPKLDSNGKIIGDSMTIEMNEFYRSASNEQIRFFEILEDRNPRAAKEYILTVTSAIDVWRDDMVQLKNALELLKNEERVFENESALVRKQEDLIEVSKLHGALQRHFPDLSENIKELGDDVQKSEEVIRRLITWVKEEEDVIRTYLKRNRSEMPFLFN